MMRRTLAKRTVWQPNERLGLRPDGDFVDKVISVPVDPHKFHGTHFDLYYLVHTPKHGLGNKTVLFCAGGPGEIVRGSGVANTYPDFLTSHDYNVVIFHLRGVGFSQLPPGNEYDKFLKTSCAVDDIECIRDDFLGKDGKRKQIPWDGIVGVSHGTVLAQQYAHRYPKNVRKLILVSPISRHRFNEVGRANAFDEYYSAVLRTYRQNLKAIYTSDREEFQNEFGDLTNEQQNRIIEEVFGSPNNQARKGILARSEEAFGNVQFVTDAYSDLRHNELKRYGLDRYSLNLFRKLREFRFYGPSAIYDGPYEKLLEIGKVFRDEVLHGRGTNVGGSQPGLNQGHYRVFYSMGIQDGTNWRFLRESVDNTPNNRRAAFEAVGGNAHKANNVNKFLRKVKIDANQVIDPWDPANYCHCVPTLVLDGDADPVTAGGQAEDFYSKGLAGPRTLIRFPGSGHQIFLPSVGSPSSSEENKPPVSLISGKILVNPSRIPAGEVREVKATVTGRILNAAQKMKLEPPRDLRRRLRVHGYCVLKNREGGPVKYEDKKSKKYNIVALIENRSGRSLEIGDTKWTQSNIFFRGTVVLKCPKRIGPKKIQLVYGTLINGRKNEDHEILVKPMGNLEPELTLIGSNIIPPDMAEVWIKNQSATESVDGLSKDWVLEYGRSGLRKVFKVNVPPLGPKEITSVSVGIDGLKIDENAVLGIDLTDVDEDLKVCLSQQLKNDDRVPIVLWNMKHQNLRLEGRDWVLTTPGFSVTVRTDSVSVPARSEKVIFGFITNIRWHNPLDIKKPADLEPGLDLVGFNVLSGHKVSMLIKNNGEKVVNGTPRDWIYVDRQENASIDFKSCLRYLIYSFLVLGPARFRMAEDNKILETMRRQFNERFLSITIEHRDQSGDN